MKRLVCLLTVILILLSVSLTAIKYDPSQMTDNEKMTKKLVSEKIKNLQKSGVKKVILINCTGEFLAEKTVAPGAWEGKDMTYYKKQEATRTTKLDFNQEYCVELVSQVKDKVVDMFTNAGIEVLPDEAWQSHPVYQQMVKHMEEYDEDKGTKSGMFSQTVTTRTIKVPAYGLRLVPDGLISAFKYTVLDTQQKGKILEDTGAQAFVRVYTYVGYGAKWTPFLRTFDIFIDSGLKKYNAGKDKFTYSVTATDNLSMKDIIEYRSGVLGGKYIDTDQYSKAVLDMIDYMLGLYEPILQKNTALYLKE